ncbi:aminotransferase [Peribacillus sp. FSL H8-0477]|uniref:aminotransferase n=1 Tax=Peribacillus sp. FSL H8-0477 TaxID=2921388 RepID=UPI0030FA7696
MTNENYVSKTVASLPPSGIRKFFDLAANMEGVVSLGVGEPDFVTSWSVREAAIHSLEEGRTSYTANAGLLELRTEIAGYMEQAFNVSYQPEHQILVTVGASEGIDLALRSIINPGEEVLVVSPCFVSYAPLVTMAGGVPKIIHTTGENQFKLTPAELEEAITPNTKAMIICSPNNPTGTQLNKEELIKIAEIIKKNDLLVIADEIYAELAYDETFTSFASVGDMINRTILINGFSKSFAMTGWRLGFVCAPREILEAMLKLHQYTMMCAPTMAQYGALEALKHGWDDVEDMRTSYRQRRNYIVKSFNEIGLTCHNPGGAFYAFPSIAKTGLSSQKFAEKLLLEERVAVVPGDVFGESGEGYIRCSYASSLVQLQEAVKRIARFMKNYQ